MLDGPVRTDDTLGMRKARRLGTLNRRYPKGGDAVVRLNGRPPAIAGGSWR
jgi:hypothetical protein